MLTDTRRRMLLDEQIRYAEAMKLEPRITADQSKVLDTLIRMYRRDDFSERGELEQLTQVQQNMARMRYDAAMDADRAAQRAAMLAADAKHVAAEEYSRWWRLYRTAVLGGNIDPLEAPCESK